MCSERLIEWLVFRPPLLSIQLVHGLRFLDQTRPGIAELLEEDVKGVCHYRWGGNCPPWSQAASAPVYNDGTIERFAGTEVSPAGLDPATGVLSRDVIIVPETNVSARLYRPKSIDSSQKIPVLVYFHGGGFLIASSKESKYHHCLNQLVASANVIAVSVDYRLAPEHPLPAAYEDSWAALHWVAAHAIANQGSEPWLKDLADFGRLFLAGDSAGANIAHHLAFRVNESDPGLKMKIRGIVMIHPYFWGKDPIGTEAEDGVFSKQFIDDCWESICPSNNGCDDPYINPFAGGAPSLKGLACDSVLIFVAEKDILCGRGKLYWENLVKSGWQGKAEIAETKGEDHVFFIFNPNCENARILIKRWASFIKYGLDFCSSG